MSRLPVEVGVGGAEARLAASQIVRGRPSRAARVERRLADVPLPPALCELYANARVDDEFYLGRLTVLSATAVLARHAARAAQGAARPVDVAIEAVDAHRVRLHACTADGTVHSRVVAHPPSLDPWPPLTDRRPVDDFLQGAVRAAAAQRACDDLRHREKCVDGRYVPSPVLVRADDAE